MQECYLPTGNEWVSLPTLQARTGALESFSFLHMGYKGLIEQRGGASLPLMTPFFETEGERASLQSLTWGRESDWIPTFCGTAGSLAVEGMLLAPVGERGFLYQLTVRSTSDKPLSSTFGLEGCWASAWHCVNEDKEIDGARRCYTSLWNDSLIFDMRCGLPLFAFAPMMDQPCSSTFQETDAGIVYRLAHDCTLEPGEAVTVTFYWGVGFEEVAAATSAKEMLRQGWQHGLQVTTDWLDARRWPIPDAQLERLYNTNLFFCLFYSAGITLDTEELVLVTSRSPRYYVSAAYWDRDSLLWSFPTVVDADPALARRMLDYVFGRQRRNLGVHSRYIDGTVLEPGFELDELMAPVLALGLSPFIMQSTESLVNIAFNSSLKTYGGDPAVGAMTICSSIMQVFSLLFQGLSQGAQPIVGYNYGAGQLDRVKRTFRLLFFSSLCFSCAACAALELFPGLFVSLFNDKPELVEIAVWALHIYAAGMFMLGVQFSCQQTFVALGQTRVSLFLALLRKVILLIPLILLLPRFLSDQVFAVFLAEPVADILAATTTGAIFFWRLPRILEKRRLELEHRPI